MDKEAIEFWNGALKATIVADKLLKESGSIEEARKQVGDLKEKLEDIHARSISRAMETLIE